MRRSYLSGRSLVVLSLWVLFGTISIFIPLILPVYLGVGVCIVTALITELRVRLILDRITLDITGPSRLEVRTTGSIDGEVTGATVPHELSVSLRLSAELSTTSPRITVADGRFSLPVHASRVGVATVSEARIFLTSPLGLWFFEKEYKVEPLSIPVLPSLAPMTEQAFHALRSRHPHLHQGLRLLSRNSAPDQYFSSRPYQYPDPLRHIDPRKSARFGTPFTKTYDSLHEKHVVVAVDVGRACVGTIDGAPKHDYYRAAALWIIQHAIHLGDSASFIAFADDVEFIVPRSRSLRAFDALRTTPKLHAQDVASSYDGLYAALQQVAPQRSVVIVLTDIGLPSLQEQLTSFLPRASQKHLCYAVGMLEDALALEVKIGRVSDEPSESEYIDLLYSYWLDESYRNLSLSLSRSGAEAIAVPQSYWMNTCVRIYEHMRTSMAA